MIHQLLTLTRPLIVFDTETTGLNRQTARIVELGFRIWTAEGLKAEWRSLVNPETPISARTSEIHGITDAMMAGCRMCGRLEVDHHLEDGVDETGKRCEGFKPIPTFKQIAPRIAAGFSNCDFGGKNVRFDLTILAAEFERAKVDWTYAGARIIDGDRLEALLNPRDLSTLYRKYTGRELEGAHGALADVRGTEEVLCGQLKVGEVDLTTFQDKERVYLHGSHILPRDLDALHTLQWPNFVDTEGKFKFDNGTPVVAFGKYNGTPMKDVDPSYWDWILRGGFNAEVKTLAAEAKMKKFPEVKA